MMPRQLHVSIAVDLPADPFAAGAVCVALQPSWATLLEALKACGAEYDVKFSDMEVRTKGPQRGRPRKPRLVPPPEAA